VGERVSLNDLYYCGREDAALHILRSLLPDDADEFWAWYVPGQWLGIHLAVAAFIAERMARK
jgi:hypothetical protein